MPAESLNPLAAYRGVRLPSDRIGWSACVFGAFMSVAALGVMVDRTAAFQAETPIDLTTALSASPAEMVESSSELSPVDPEVPATAGTVAGRYLLVSSHLCNPSQPNCQIINAILRYNLNPGPNYGRYDGVHIGDGNIPGTAIGGPYGMMLHPTRGTIIAVSRHTHSIREYNKNTGAFLGNFVVAGAEGLNLPQNFVFLPNGNLLVTSTITELQFDKVNGLIEFDGETGAFVRIFKNGGAIEADSCEPPDFPHCLRGPAAMSLSSDGTKLYVASQLNDRVVEYNSTTGDYIGVFDSSKLKQPIGMAVRPAGSVRAGNLLITTTWTDPLNPNDTSHKVVEFDRVTRELTTAISGGVFCTGLKNPGPIIFDKYDTNDSVVNVFISDRTFWEVPFGFSDRIRVHQGQTGSFLNFLIQPTTDARLHYNTGMFQTDIGCTSDEECNDGNPCTDDVCETGLCSSTIDNSNDPDDGLFCNGVESTCMNGVVQYSQPAPNCNDGRTCTVDSCNENTDQCDNILMPDKCLIAGVCRNFGDPNPQSGCLECNPSISPTDWSPRPVGTACGNPNNSECDNPDTCNATGICMSNFEDLGTSCGSSMSNACTQPDTCDGAGGCSFNNAPNGTTCDDGHFCTVTDTCFTGQCSGAGNPCEGDPLLPFCVEEEGMAAACVQCLVDEDCPDDGLPCTRAQCVLDAHECFHFPDDSECDDGQFCNGMETCNAVTGLCDSGVAPCAPGFFCNEVNDTCADCGVDADCDNGVFCDGVEECQGGTCVAGTAVDCSSLDTACRVGICDENVDACVPLAGNEGGVCNDNNPCTTNDRCAAGECVGGAALVCNDNNACTTDSCNPASGCVFMNNNDPCNDNNPCTMNDACSGGACVGGPPASCDDNNVCTTDSCHPVLGCRHINNLLPCDDGSVCTLNDTCFGGLCLAGTPRNCSDNNVCTDDSCHPVQGCQHGPNTQACNDGDACTTSDVCANMVCVGGPPPDCNDNDVCTNDVCTGGSCQHPPNTAPCNDGNLCTTNDVCGGGQCGGTPVVCPPGNHCDPADGVCRPCVNDGNCNDNNVCTDDHCMGGACVFTNNTAACNDGDPCTELDACSAGQCSGRPVICPPNQVCNSQVGGCTACATAQHCDDGNPCTDESCVAGLCQYANNTLPCNDGRVCTENDVCGGGVCSGQRIQCPSGQNCDASDGQCRACEEDLDCDDENPCTDDSCIPPFGCFYQPNTDPCDDGKNCTTSDTCWRGLCRGTPPAQCVDGDACTADGCTDAGMCTNVPICGLFGDIFPPGGNCAVDLDDLICSLDGFANPAACPEADLFPCGGDGVIAVDDILIILEIFEGVFRCPDMCP